MKRRRTLPKSLSQIRQMTVLLVPLERRGVSPFTGRVFTFWDFANATPNYWRPLSKEQLVSYMAYVNALGYTLDTLYGPDDGRQVYMIAPLYQQAPTTHTIRERQEERIAVLEQRVTRLETEKVLGEMASMLREGDLTQLP